MPKYIPPWRISFKDFTKIIELINREYEKQFANIVKTDRLISEWYQVNLFSHNSKAAINKNIWMNEEYQELLRKICKNKFSTFEVAKFTFTNEDRIFRMKNIKIGNYRFYCYFNTIGEYVGFTSASFQLKFDP